MSKSVSNKAYIKVIIELQRLFAETYPTGGWLPSGRDMAQKLGVAYRTYWKAINCLAEEHFVRSYHGKGYYVVPDSERCHKIGIIIGDGGISPFFANCDDICKSLLFIRQNRFDVHQIQGTHPEQLYENAVAHGVEGLLWFNPTSKSVACINNIYTADDLPLVVIQSDNSLPTHQACSVSYDSHSIGRQKAEFIVSRGHRRVVIINDNSNDRSLKAMLEVFEQKDHVVEHHIFSNVKDNQEEFCRLVNKVKPTAIICGGGPVMFKTIARTLQPVINEPIEMLLGIGENDYGTINDVPFIKLFLEREKCCFYEIGANLLIQHLHHNQPLKNILVKEMLITENSYKKLKVKCQ